MNKDQDPTIIVNERDAQDTAQVEQQERLKEKLKYKQALRENAKKIDHKQVRLNIQADALPSKTYFIMNALAVVIPSLDLKTLAEGQQVVPNLWGSVQDRIFLFRCVTSIINLIKSIY